MKQVVLLRARPRNLAYLGLAVNLLQSTLASAANEVPFPKQFTELPPPRRAAIITTIETSPAEDGNPPVVQLEWRNPQFNNNPGVRNKTWVNNNLQDTLIPVTNNPFVPTIQLNPSIRRSVNQDWINPALGTVEAAFPIGKTSQFNPIVKSKNDVSWTSKAILVNEIPSGQSNQLNPLIGRANQVGYIQNRPQYYTDLSPHNQYNWPNPRIKETLRPSLIVTRTFFPTPLELNFLPVAYPNPLYKGRLRPEFVKLPSFIQLETIFPDGKQTYNNPVVRLKPKPQDHIQVRPSFYTEPSLAVLSTQVFELPPRRTKRLIVRINTRFPQPANQEKPFNETMQWPNPVLRVKRAIPWDDHYIFDDNQPPIAQVLNVPQRKRFYDASYIQPAQLLVALSGTPIPVKDWPNPIIIKRPTLGEINNLLQHPFALAPGDKPFFEDKWPNPIVAARNYHQGWIQETKKYYVEEPLQPNQYDWPIFRSPRRHHVGYIDYRIGESSPTFVSVTDVPLRGKAITLSFIDNPINRIFPPVEIIKPFAQYDWPVVVRVRRFEDFIKWIDLNLTTLPLSVGRVICLQMNDTEYFLEISVEDYDLEIRDTDYDIDIGGNECE